MPGLYADSASPSCVGNFQQYHCDNSSWKLNVHFIPRMLWAISATSSWVSVFRIMIQTRLDVRGFVGSITGRRKKYDIFLYSPWRPRRPCAHPSSVPRRKEIRREIVEHLYRTGYCGLSPRSRWDLWSSWNYTAHNGNSLPTFRDNLSVPFSRVNKSSSWIAWSLNVRPIGSPETSVMNYHHTLRDIQEERGSQLNGNFETPRKVFQIDIAGIRVR